MKRFSFIALLLTAMTLSLSAQEQEKGIKFVHGTLDEAFEASKKAGKPLFVDIWASWCGPCKRLGREIFPQEEVGKFFNERFVCYKLQTDPKDSVALKKAKEFSEKYYVKFLPTLVWIDTDGELMHYCTGFMQANELIAQAKMALDPKQRSAQYIKSWKEGDRSAQTGMNYFRIFNKETEEIDKWYQALSFDDRTDSTMTIFMTWRVSLPPTSTTFEYVARQAAQYKERDPHDMWTVFLTKGLKAQLGAAKDSLEAVAIANRWAGYNLSFTDYERDKYFVDKAYKEGRFAEGSRQLEVAIKNGLGKNMIYQVLFTLAQLRMSGKMTVDQAPAQIVAWTEASLSGEAADERRNTLARVMAYCVSGNQQKATEWANQYKKITEKDPMAEQHAEMADRYLSVFKK